jgi:hypothetical protein
MSSEGYITRNHRVIKEWAEQRGGKPVKVRGLDVQDDPNVLRIAFSERIGREFLEPISWDDFFDAFDRKGLTFLFQEQTTYGEQSTFFRVVEENKKSH